jgi:uncharacterized membrane protein
MPIMEEQKMKKLFSIGVVALLLAASNSFAQMSTGQGGGMMGGWGWGMGYGWGFGIIIVILVVLVLVYMMKRR